MSEQHSGIPHDLPEYAPNDPPQIFWRRVRVFKEGSYWTWEHQCPWKAGCPSNGYPHLTQKIALTFALDHARRCL